VKVRAVEARILAVAPWLLGLSVLVHFALVLTQTKMTMIDLKVYRDGSPALLQGTLYDWHLTEPLGQFALPFTYPPFAAVLFLPLSWLPWVAVRVLWQAASVVCLWWLVRLSLKLIARDRDEAVTDDVWRQRVMFATAAALWIGPRSTPAR